MPSCIHIYCGDGKGKTTAAIGLAVRAAGRDRKVLLARFLKTDDSGEIQILAEIPQITVIPCEKTFGFFFQMSEFQKSEAGKYYTDLLIRSFAEAASQAFDMLILDEALAAANHNLIPESRLIACIQNRPQNLEVILTGRSPSKSLTALADYVSEIKKIKHPYERGIAAREGIEY